MFQMQTWSSKGLRWEPMEEGAAPAVWRPRATAAEAIAKCLAWTGFHCIPSMQVVDITSGRVVWRGLMEPFHHDGEWHFVAPEAGQPIDSEDERLARRIAQTMLSRPEPATSPQFDQAALF